MYEFYLGYSLNPCPAKCPHLVMINADANHDLFSSIDNSTNLLGIIRCGIAPHPLPCSIARAPAKAVALELRPRVGVGLIVEQDLQPILFNVVHNGSAVERRLGGHVLSRSLELFNPYLDAPYLRAVVR